MSFVPGVYEHYKGGKYVALHLVTHHETGEQFVVYVSCTHGTLRLREYATPGKDSWDDAIGAFPNQVPRFKWLGPAST